MNLDEECWLIIKKGIYMKMQKVIFPLLLLLCLTVGVSQAQLKIDAGFFNSDLEVFFLRDLDLTNPGSSPMLFWVNFTNTGAENRYVILSLEIQCDRYGSLASGKTRPFGLGHGVTRTITNRDLGQSGSLFELDEYVIADAAKDLTRAILSTGSLPTDFYHFVLKIQDVNNPGIADSKTIDLTITNPTTLELVSPGRIVDQGELPTLFTTLPQFVWDSNAGEFSFTVCEQLPSNSSPEDVMDNEPRFHTTIQNAKNLIYPSSGAFPIEEGHTYYWQVKAIMMTTGGPVELKSEIWGFKIGSTQNVQLESQMIILRSALQGLLGDDAVNALFNEGGDLYQFLPTGVIFYKGRSLTIQELQTLAQQVNSGVLEIIDYHVE